MVLEQRRVTARFRRLAADLAERPHLDARGAHVDEEEREPAVLRELGIRVRLEAGSQDPPTAHGAIRVTGRAQADVAPPEPEPLKDLGW